MTAIVVIPATLTARIARNSMPVKRPVDPDAVLTAAAGAQPQITGAEVMDLGNESGTTTVGADGGVRIVVRTGQWHRVMVLEPDKLDWLVGTPYAPMFVEIDGSVSLWTTEARMVPRMGRG